MIESTHSYTKAVIEEAEEFLWKNYGISVGTPDYMWSNDRIIEEAIKKGWKFSVSSQS